MIGDGRRWRDPGVGEQQNMGATGRGLTREAHDVLLEATDVEYDQDVVAAEVEQMLGPCRGLALHQLDAGAKFAKVQVEMRREAGGEAAADQKNAPPRI